MCLRMFITTKTLAIALALTQTSNALKATILADTNRDGKVDVEGNTDLEDKEKWTNERGALFLANIGDTDQRCTKNITVHTPDEELDKCNDASGIEQRNPKYLAPLKTVPIEELSTKAFGSITITNTTASNRVRIFVKDEADWTYVHSNYTFTADRLKNGLELGIDARDVRRPEWDGKATVQFSVIDGNDEAHDSVTLRVAPLLTHHHNQPAERVFTSKGDHEGLPGYKAKFVVDLKNNTALAGIEDDVFEFLSIDPKLYEGMDPWTQDFFEPGYTSIPGPNGPVVLRVMIRSAQNTRPTGRYVFTDLRSDTVGAVQYLRDGDSIDSMGNLETIPPYSHNGKTYPAGRIIMGAWDQEEPLIIPFLQAQEIQEPLILDTVWLGVGHVDEFLQFLPANNERGWVLIASDPSAGVELLQKASQDGHGGNKAYSRPRFDYDEDVCVPNTTIDELLTRNGFLEANEKASKHIKGNIEVLRKETGLNEDEIFRVPALVYFVEFPDYVCPGNNKSFGSISSQSFAPKTLDQIKAIGLDKLDRRQQPNPEKAVVALYPDTTNGVVLSKSYYLAPNPWGPIVNGKDVIAERVRAAYARANYDVHYMDDFFSHHTGNGEIHCGSNTWRNTDTPWW